jgi:hypothetical protein
MSHTGLDPALMLTVVLNQGAAPKTYYLDATGGNDANTGLSTAAPWQTIAKVNGSTFNAGETICFKRGEAWSTTQLLITQSGAAGKPLIFDAYGSGAQPLIQSPVGANNRAVYITGNYVTVKNIHTLSQEHKTNLAYCIEATGHDITIDTCTAEGNKTLGTPFNNAHGINIDGAAAACYNIIVQNCTVYNCACTNGRMGIVAANATYPGPTDVQFLNNTVHDVGIMTYTYNQFGMYFLRVNRGLMSGNLVYNTDSDGIQIEYTTNSVVEKNTVHHAGINGITIFFASAGDNLIIRNNLVYLSRRNGFTYDNSCAEANVFHNTFVNNATAVTNCYGISLPTTTIGANIQNNLIVQDAAVVFSGATCMRAEDDTVIDNSTAIDYNCCIFLNYTTPDRAHKVGGVYKSLANWKLAGTTKHPDAHGISVDPKLSSSVYTAVDADSNSGQKVLNVASTVGFNAGDIVAICPDGARHEYGTIDTIQAGVSLTLLVNLTSTHTAAQTDVVMSCVWTNFHLQSTSPCRGAGVNVGVLTDFDGVARPDPPSIGAYEFV